MKITIMAFLLMFSLVFPAYATEDDIPDHVENAIAKAREKRLSPQAQNRGLNDAQIFEKKMLERRAQKRRGRKTKRISGSAVMGGNRATSDNAATASSGRTNSRPVLSKDSGMPSVASGMFVK